MYHKIRQGGECCRPERSNEVWPAAKVYFTPKENMDKLRQKRIAEGLCSECGGILDTDGKTCSRCRKKWKERRDWYKSHGICPYCMKERLFGDEGRCPECRAKIAEGQSKWRKNRTDSEMAEYRAKGNAQKRKKENERKAEGMCTRCGKRRAKQGYVKCDICLGKFREYSKRHYDAKRYIKNGGILRKEYVENGLCYICGQPLDRDGGACVRCTERIRENLKKRGKGTHWDETNIIFFLDKDRQHQ